MKNSSDLFKETLELLRKNRRKYQKMTYTLIKVDFSKKLYPLHRLIVEEFIRRKLTKEEVVHHLNGNKKDNRISNLMIFPNQKEHKSFENKVKQFGFTKNIIREIENRWDKYFLVVK